jgi:carboxyl-terminal processing protease
VQTVIEMEDGSGLKLTIARYYTPSGRSIQERGILPEFIVGEAEGALVSKPDQLRERDLKRHFRNEAAPAEEGQLKPNLPEPLKPWEVTEKLTDYQLKIALNHLNALGPSQQKTTARAP